MEPSVPPPLNDTAKGSVDVARVDSPEVRVIFSLLSCSRLREGRKMWATEFDWLYLEEASNKTRVKRIWVTAHFRVINELMTPSRHCTLDIWICHKKFLKELYEAEISNFMRFDLNQSWWKWCLKFCKHSSYNFYLSALAFLPGPRLPSRCVTRREKPDVCFINAKGIQMFWWLINPPYWIFWTNAHSQIVLCSIRWKVLFPDHRLSFCLAGFK